MKSISRALTIFLSFLAYIAVAQDFTGHVITDAYDSWSAVSADMDNDGDQDIIGTSRMSNHVSWWENDGNENFTLHSISSTAHYAMGVAAADLDRDGDKDVICAVQEENAILWWENNGAGDFIQHVMVDILSPGYIDISDLDGDNDTDILVAACEDGSDQIAWVENIDGGTYDLHVIRDNWDNANSIHAADMDYDGDLDIIGTASFRYNLNTHGEISWFENDGYQNFTEHNIISNFGRPSDAIAIDIDQDNDMDVVATICQLNQVVLFENDGSLTFNPIIIQSDFVRPHCVFAADLDNDTDIDLQGTSIDLNQVVWWENQGSGFNMHVITSDFGGATCVNSADIDGDGDMDILATAQYANKITWWENELMTGIKVSKTGIENSGNDILAYPNPFNDNTSIRFRIYTDTKVNLTIYDGNGKQVAQPLNKELKAGDHYIIWDGMDYKMNPVSKGLYYYELRSDGWNAGGKILKY